MRVEQYVYFALKSTSASATEMTAHVGLSPDEVMVRGSRISDPPRPICHSWQIVCKERGLTVDEQIGDVMDRLRPFRDRIAELTGGRTSVTVTERVSAVLEVVRYFDYPDGEEEELSPPDAELQKLAGQHQLLSWSLDREVLEFLLSTGAFVDVDEYG